MNAPCKNCPDRHEACWGHCEKYKAWKAEYQKEQEAVKERKMRDRESFLRSEKVGRAYFRVKKGYDQ